MCHLFHGWINYRSARKSYIFDIFNCTVTVTAHAFLSSFPSSLHTYLSTSMEILSSLNPPVSNKPFQKLASFPMYNRPHGLAFEPHSHHHSNLFPRSILGKPIFASIQLFVSLAFQRKLHLHVRHIELLPPSFSSKSESYPESLLRHGP